MFGREINRLNVLRKSQSNETLIWTKQGNQGNVWLNGQVNLDSSSDFSVVFEGVVGLGFLVRNLKFFLYSHKTIFITNEYRDS
jgi:hypothetical protein